MDYIFVQQIDLLFRNGRGMDMYPFDFASCLLYTFTKCRIIIKIQVMKFSLQTTLNRFVNYETSSRKHYWLQMRRVFHGAI